MRSEWRLHVGARCDSECQVLLLLLERRCAMAAVCGASAGDGRLCAATSSRCHCQRPAAAAAGSRRAHIQQPLLAVSSVVRWSQPSSASARPLTLSSQSVVCLNTAALSSTFARLAVLSFAECHLYRLSAAALKVAADMGLDTQPTHSLPESGSLSCKPFAGSICFVGEQHLFCVWPKQFTLVMSVRNNATRLTVQKAGRCVPAASHSRCFADSGREFAPLAGSVTRPH